MPGNLLVGCTLPLTVEAVADAAHGKGTVQRPPQPGGTTQGEPGIHGMRDAHGRTPAPVHTPVGGGFQVVIPLPGNSCPGPTAPGLQTQANSH
jgi:hypothetical protein